MESRFLLEEAIPEAMPALFALEKFLSQTKISPVIVEILKIRVSQINGCAYCIKSHTSFALKLGEDPIKLMSIAAWRESSLFTDNERAVLQFADEITKIYESGLSDGTYTLIKTFFSGEEIAQLTLFVTSINTWNRIAISTRLN
ncbi:MAG: AhpD family alkylhydroperoxidase [Crocinitomix sp.]|jgi:AhpD family alkylhydroperoxidase